MQKIIRAGDKIDIKYLHQKNDKIYKSSVFDFLGGNEIEITMPTDAGKMVLFNQGVQFEFFFYTARGMYTCEAVVTDRYKRGNFFLISVEVVTPLKKYQRREYYRLECLLDFAYYKISDELAALETNQQMFLELSKPEYILEKRLARAKDLSGGGSRFMTLEPLEVGSKVLSVLHLVNDKVDRTFYLVTEVIGCDPVKDMKDRWIVRGKFEYKDIKERDLVVRYVFEEDRRLRKKENGK